MNAYHVFVSVFNIMCGAAVIVGSNFDMGGIAGLGVYLGYFANLIAIAICLFLVVLLIIRIPSGTSKKLLASSWLGFLNGFAVVGIWSVVSWAGYL